MAQFLRDQQIRNFSITIARIEELFSLFERFGSVLRTQGAEDVFVSCVIRFDEKGHRVFSFDDLKRIYQQAEYVERLVFSVETGESLRSNRHAGAFMDLRLDRTETNGFLTVSADDPRWVDAGFSAVTEALAKSRAWYRFVRHPLIELVIQVTGVALVFLFSLAAAKMLASHVTVDNPFLIAFMFVFLLSANVWGYLQRQIHGAIGRMFPNVQFVKEGREYLHWFVQGCVTAVAGAIVMYAVTETTNALLGTTGAFVK